MKVSTTGTVSCIPPVGIHHWTPAEHWNNKTMAQQSHPLKWHSQAISVAKTPLWEIGSISLCKVSFNRHRTTLLYLSWNSVIQVKPHLLVNMVIFLMEFSPVWNKAIFWANHKHSKSEMKISLFLSYYSLFPGKWKRSWKALVKDTFSKRYFWIFAPWYLFGFLCLIINQFWA